MASAIAFMLVTIWYVDRFYPYQELSVGIPVPVYTPEPEIYLNDCLHPCIRVLGDNEYVMVQSPWPAGNDGVENPILYFSTNPYIWCDGKIVKQTPVVGYNSDPNVFFNNDGGYLFWREVGTQLCKERGVKTIVVGGKLDKEGCIAQEKVYIEGKNDKIDCTKCPILIEHEGKLFFYTTWYRDRPKRENIGLAIYEGTSLEYPDFKLIDTVRFHNPLVCDKYVQKKIFGHLFFIPIPKKYDLWHFDLFEYKGALFMVSCAEMDDNIMLSVSHDWKHFKTFKRPLLNSHYSENHVGYRQFYYKPTAAVINDSLYLWYTSNSGHPYENKLFLSKMAMKDIL